MPRPTQKPNDEPLRGKKRPSAHDEDHASSDGGPTKKVKTAGKKSSAQVKGKKGGEEAGEVSWELTDKRRVQISEFKGMQMVAIREFYEKEGEMLPGKKGISLTVPQYNALVALLPQIETALFAKGETVVRPDYAEAVNGDEEGGEGEGEGETEGDLDEEGEMKRERGGRGEEEGKRNFEATSEEEEGG